MHQNLALPEFWKGIFPSSCLLQPHHSALQEWRTVIIYIIRWSQYLMKNQNRMFWSIFLVFPPIIYCLLHKGRCCLLNYLKSFICSSVLGHFQIKLSQINNPWHTHWHTHAYIYSLSFNLQLLQWHLSTDDTLCI